MRKMTRLIGTAAVVVLVLVVGLNACDRPPTLAPATSDTPVPSMPSDTPVPPVPSDTPDLPVAPPTSTPTAAAPPPAAHSILEGTLKALAGVDSWQVELEMDVSAPFRSLTVDIPATYVGDFRAPDRLEGTASVQLLGVTVEKDIVLMARTVDVTDPASGATMGSMFSLLDLVGWEPADIRDLELVGEETLDGIPVYHLKGRVSVQEMEIAPGGVRSTLQGDVRFEVWIGIADSLPRQGVVEGELAVSGAAQGTIHGAGTATFSDFGQPVAAESVSQPVAAVGMPCAVAGSEFTAYSDEARAISFCYPSGWVVDDFVDGCGFFAVSPTGVGPGQKTAEGLVLVYPHETVARLTPFPSGTTEVCGQTALCFLKWARGGVLTGDVKAILGQAQEAIAWAARVLLREEPLVVIVTGLQYAEGKAVTVGFVVDEDAYRPTVEAITHSIIVGRSAPR